ncbi:uncharacterized protein LOC143300056 [Babylonia areolata]|uniref:uncharacterized protein LOC143300056 n=1 Tax=Babylonia areolata TaxID=304850 RepID=UPI003FCF8DBA
MLDLYVTFPRLAFTLECRPTTKIEKLSQTGCDVERTVCASLTGRGDQKESKDILCVSCYCKLQQDHKESVDSGNVAKNQVSQQDNSGQESPCRREIQTESPSPPGNLQRSLSELHQSECSGSQTTPPQIEHVPEAALLLQREGSGSRQELVKSTTNSSTFMKFVNQALTPTIVGSVVAGVTVAVMEFVFGWHWAVVLAGLLSLVVYAVGKYHPAVQRFFLDDLAAALDEGGQTDTILLDFSKAFDKVPHRRLLLKLRHYGIRGQTLRWTEEFLTNRTQQVNVEGQISTIGQVTSRVPQGSVLGPTLFVIYINNINKNIRSTVL